MEESFPKKKIFKSGAEFIVFSDYVQGNMWTIRMLHSKRELALWHVGPINVDLLQLQVSIRTARLTRNLIIKLSGTSCLGKRPGS